MDQNGWFLLEPNQPNYNYRTTPKREPERQQPQPKQQAESQQPDIQPQEKAAPEAPAPAVQDSAAQPEEEQIQRGTADPYQDELQTVHSQTVGPRGPVLMQDGLLHETLEDFVHTKPIERAVHVKGFGAMGHFKPYQCMKDYTRLCFLQDPNQETPVTARFSLAVSNKGTPDTSRNVRGFSTKFYTPEGVFDLLCNHIPVFLVRDAIRFPEAINSLLPSPINNLIDQNRFWDFIARAPEATHFITWLYSDAGTLKSLRHLRGYGVNTYTWVNKDGKRRYVKYHWLPKAGEQYIDRQEAARLAGENPDIAGQDLYDTIAKGQPVEYELNVQLMDPEDQESLPFDPLDDTKTWDQEQYPLMPVGLLTLDRNPTDYTAQTEKLAFSPANLLDGAELSNDKMLQGRSTIYWDAQRRRLGPDFRDIPINKGRDWTPDSTITSGNGQYVSGELTRSDIPKQDDFAQAGQRYDILSDEQKAHLIDNIAAELYAVPAETQRTVMGYFRRASQDFADRLEQQIEQYKQD